MGSEGRPLVVGGAVSGRPGGLAASCVACEPVGGHLDFLPHSVLHPQHHNPTPCAVVPPDTFRARLALAENRPNIHLTKP